MTKKLLILFITKLSKFTLLLLFFVLNSFSQSAFIIDSLKKRSIQAKDTALIELYNEISWEYKNLNIDSAFVYANKALKLSKKIKHQRAIANSYNTIGSNFEYIANLDSALFFYEKSLFIKRKIKDFVGIANSLNNVGIINDEKGNHEAALKNYFGALKIYETQQVDFDKVPMVLVNIGIVYKKQGDYNKTLEYYLKALKIYEINKYRVGIVITKGNIGNIQLKLKKYNEAIKYSVEARSMYDSLGYQRYVPYMNVQIANAKDSLKLYKEAQKLYLNAIVRFEEDKNYQELTDAKIGLANNYFLTGLYKKSKKEITEALEIIQDKGFKDFEIRAIEVLYKTNYKLGNYQEAYQNTLQYIDNKEVLFEKEKIKSLHELAIKYETEKKEKELLKAKTQKIETEYELEKSRNWIYALLFCLVIIVFVFLILMQVKKRKMQEAQLKLKEIAFNAVIEAQENERNIIARELHDGVVQEIGSIILNSRSLFSKNDTLKQKESQDFLTRLENSNQDLRTISHQMMPRALTELGATAAIEDLINFSFSNTSIECIFEHFNIQERLPQKIETTIYRISQELINNIIKHSKATKASFQLFKNDNHLIMITEDNGVGFSEEKTKNGIGLLNITSRLQLINGTFNYGNSSEKGTLITIKIPLENAY